jgi:hypothetical protein
MREVLSSSVVISRRSAFRVREYTDSGRGGTALPSDLPSRNPVRCPVVPSEHSLSVRTTLTPAGAVRADKECCHVPDRMPCGVGLPRRLLPMVAAAATSFYPCQPGSGRTPLTAYAHRRSAEALREPTRLLIGPLMGNHARSAAALTRSAHRLRPALADRSYLLSLRRNVRGGTAAMRRQLLRACAIPSLPSSPVSPLPPV